jgi:hypothetical protein
MAFLAVNQEELFLKIFNNHLPLDTAWHSRLKTISSKMRGKELKMG